MSSTTAPQLLPAGGRPVVKARRPVPVQQLQLGMVLVVVTEVLVVVSTMLEVVVVAAIVVVVVSAGMVVDVVAAIVVVVVSPTMVVDVVPTMVVVVTGFVGHVQSS